MKSFALVVAGGAAGTLARHGVSEAVGAADDAFPLATFLVNVTGSFALGALLAALLVRRRGDDLRLSLGTGVLGGFTTYSALALETDALLHDNQLVLGLAYATGTVLAGLAAALAGIAAARAVSR